MKPSILSLSLSLSLCEKIYIVPMATAMAEDSSFEDDQLAAMSTDDVVRASRLLDTEIRILKVLSLSLSL